MGKICCVLNCNNKQAETNHVSYHEIPSNLKMRILWLEQLKHIMKPKSRADCKYICSFHFEEECFRKDLKKPNRLKLDAIPTKFNLTSIDCDDGNELKLINEGSSISNVPNLETLIFDENRPEDILHLTDDLQDSEQLHLPIIINDVTVKEEQCEEESFEPGLMVVEFSNKPKNQYIYNSVKFHTKDGKTDVCRICLKPTFDNIKLISQDQTKTVVYKDMVQFVLPDMNWDLYSDPQICVGCETLLVLAYEFKKKSLMTEKALCEPIKKITTKAAVNMIIYPKVLNKYKINVVRGEGKKKRYRKGHDHAKSETAMELTNKNEDKILEDDCTKKSNASQSTNDGIDNNNKVKAAFVHKRKLIPTMKDDLFDKKFDKYFSRRNRRIALKGQLSKRKRVTWGESPFLCDTCGQIFTKLIQYRRHVRMHTIKKETVESFTCDICNLTYRDINISQHYSTHHKQRQFKCEICDRQFDRQYGKMLHIKAVHEKEENAQCHICGAIMKRSSIPVHLFKHNPNNKKYKCHICNNNRTYFKSSFAIHLRAHRKPAKERVCYICGKILITGYKRHIETVHENKKWGNYNCYICNKAYTLRSALKKHFVRYHVRVSEEVLKVDTAEVLNEHTYARKEKLSVTDKEVEEFCLRAEVES